MFYAKTSSRRTKLGPQTSAVLAQTIRTIATGVLLVGMSLAEQASQEPAQPALYVETNLVVVPFQVRRGSRSVSDLKSSDVVLLEDGVPRSFTVFDAPPVHLTLDLVVMFDVTNRITPPRLDQKGRAGFWDAKALRDLADYWNEAIARRLLDGHEASIRFSIYRLDQFRLERLCQTTSDPKVLVDALRRLAAPLSVPQAASQGVDIPLPAGLAFRDMERKAQADGNPPQPWSLAGAISVLKDSAVGPLVGPGKTDSEGAMAARALVIFSTGAEGTSITPQDLANQAVSAGVAVYPVALPGFPWVLPYEGYTYRMPVKNGVYYFYPSKHEDEGGTKLSMLGPGGVFFAKGGYVGSYYNYPFELIGDVTGGLRFNALNHFVIPDTDTPGLVLSPHPDQYSMTGNETLNVLERVKRHALARFSSTYTVGFAPSPSGAPREHTLEVELGAKSTGKVTEGKRIAIY